MSSQSPKPDRASSSEANALLSVHQGLACDQWDKRQNRCKFHHDTVGGFANPQMLTSHLQTVHQRRRHFDALQQGTKPIAKRYQNKTLVWKHDIGDMLYLSKPKKTSQQASRTTYPPRAVASSSGAMRYPVAAPDAVQNMALRSKTLPVQSPQTAITRHMRESAGKPTKPGFASSSPVTVSSPPRPSRLGSAMPSPAGPPVVPARFPTHALPIRALISRGPAVQTAQPHGPPHGLSQGPTSAARATASRSSQQSVGPDDYPAPAIVILF